MLCTATIQYNYHSTVLRIISDAVDNKMWTVQIHTSNNNDWDKETIRNWKYMSIFHAIYCTALNILNSNIVMWWYLMERFPNPFVEHNGR